MLGQLVQVTAALTPAALLLAVLGLWPAPARSDVKPGGEPLIYRNPIATTRNWGVLHTHANRSGQLILAWAVAGGAIAGILLAIARELVWFTDRERVALFTLLPMVIIELVLLVVLWVSKTTAPVVRWMIAALAALLMFRVVPGMVLNWLAYFGAEQTFFSTAALLRLVGFLGGVLIVGITCWALRRASESATPLLTKAVLTATLLITALSQAVTIIQFLHARRLLMMSLDAFRVLVWGINHQSWVLFALLALVLILPASRHADRRTPQFTGDELPAERRLALAATKSARRLAALAVVGSTMIVAIVTAVAAFDSRMPELSEPEEYTIINGEAVIPLEQINDGHLHRFAYETSDGTIVRFIVIQKNGIAYGVGLDACEICGATGYIEVDGKIICRLCDVIINIATIGFRGGCNPIPLDYTVVDGSLVVQIADLEAAAPVFA